MHSDLPLLDLLEMLPGEDLYQMGTGEHNHRCPNCDHVWSHSPPKELYEMSLSERFLNEHHREAHRCPRVACAWREEVWLSVPNADICSIPRRRYRVIEAAHAWAVSVLAAGGEREEWAIVARHLNRAKATDLDRAFAALMGNFEDIPPNPHLALALASYLSRKAHRQAARGPLGPDWR